MPGVTRRPPPEHAPMTAAELAASIGRAHLAFAAAVAQATAEYNAALADERARLAELRRATAAGRKAAVRRGREARDANIAALRDRFQHERSRALAL